MNQGDPAGAALITDEYRQMQAKLHENPNYGVASLEFAPLVADAIQALQVREVLDYGAGKGRLGGELRKMIRHPLEIRHYDPAIPAWAATPAPSELVACIDVLEHIEPGLLDNVLDDLQRLVRRVGIFTVHTGPAVKVLPDGRNAHLIQKPTSWWLPKFMARFELMQFQKTPQGFWIGVEPLKGSRH